VSDVLIRGYPDHDSPELETGGGGLE
jgi:hypothetical protein